MPKICFYFQVHQPYRIKNYRVYDIGKDSHYFNDSSESKINNKKILRKVAEKCYLPANAVLKRLIERHPEFKISFSFSGVFLEQLEEFGQDVLKSFQDLVKAGTTSNSVILAKARINKRQDSGPIRQAQGRQARMTPREPRVEILDETYYHSLSFLYSINEFKKQVKMHREKIFELFGQKPNVFRNTELIYNNHLAQTVEDMGYDTILAEGADHVLGWRSPDFVYKPTGTKNIKLLLKNYKLSDDIAFRFSEKSWKEWPLTVPKFSQWVSNINGNGEVVNLFMDYETFGEHQWEDTGIFNFLESLPTEILKNPDNGFVTPSEAARYEPKGELDIPNYVSWADVERDLSAWRSNAIQHDALSKIYEIEDEVLNTKDVQLIHDWRKLQTSDHFYYMCTKWFNDGDVHKYFNPYDSPYEAFIAFMNALRDLKLRIGDKSNSKMVRRKDKTPVNTAHS